MPLLRDAGRNAQQRVLPSRPRRAIEATMFKQIDGVLSAAELSELNGIADSAPFVDGRITNPHNSAKNNLQLHDAAFVQRSAKLLADALYRSEEFRNYAFPK